jgi:hypothetical protein
MHAISVTFGLPEAEYYVLCMYWLTMHMSCWPAGGCTRTHTIRSGDTCWSLIGAAGGYGLPEGQAGVDRLLQLNPGLNCAALSIGQVLCVMLIRWVMCHHVAQFMPSCKAFCFKPFTRYQAA